MGKRAHRTGVRCAVMVSAIVVTMAAVGGGPASGATGTEQPSPKVTGPVTGGTRGGPTLSSTAFDVTQHGYTENEYFVSGTATSYQPVGTLASDGKWDVTTGETADFTTRILVRRPKRPVKFNGTVVVEWLNVSGGLDAAPDWNLMHTLLMREGFAWVGVSAQSVGVNGGGLVIGPESMALKLYDPERYRSLVHPGDRFSYDIFSQVGKALRARQGPDPLQGLKPKRMLAIGESQSASRLTSYIDAVQPVARVYDGFLVHSRGAGAPPLTVDSIPQGTVAEVPTPLQFRDDLDVPVLVFETETDVINGYVDARQPDTKRFRAWEVAGTAHYDLYGLQVGSDDVGPAAKDPLSVPPQNSVANGLLVCSTPINQGPQVYVLQSAMSHLDHWVRGSGKGAPPKGATLHVAPDTTPRTYDVDEHGNVLGGIRTPAVDVPIAKLTGTGQAGSRFCNLFGETVLFDDATVASLYPSHLAYVKAVQKATTQAVKQGFVLAADAPAIVAAARHSTVGS
jgi:hypothetical protein